MPGKADGHLHLFATGDTAVKAPTVSQNGVDHGVVLGAGLQRQLTADHVVGQVSQQLEIGHLGQQIQGKKQVIGQSIAMGFQQHRKVHLFGQPLPAFGQFHRLRQAARPNIGL